jgi:hypothetical protein
MWKTIGLLACGVVSAALVAGCQPSNNADAGGQASSVALSSSALPTSASAAGSTAATESAASAQASSHVPTASPTSAVTTPASVVQSSSAALTELATLAVKGRAPMTGYSRDQFGPAWPTIEGCDERNDTLRRDLTDITLSGSCIVTSGTLVSPYSGTTIHFVRGPHSADVQIDHVVALGDAWQTGAAQWSSTEREAFANDPEELLAVDAHSNEQKGDGDAATWLPANKAFRCTYVSIQVNVKARYHLWVTPAEHDAIARILSSCTGVVAPTAAGTTVAAPAKTTAAPTRTTAAVATTPAAPAKTTAAAHSYVTPGAFCSTAGATGVSKTGKPMVCKTTATDARLRWRSA